MSGRDKFDSVASDSEVEIPPRPWLTTVLGVAAAIGALLLVGFLALVVYSNWLWNRFDAGFREAYADPKAVLTRTTGFAWPSEGRIEYFHDDHGWPSDGTFYLIVEVDRATLERWKAGPPAFGAKEWTTEPLPDEATTSCYFKKDVSFARNGIVHYALGEKIRKPGWTSDAGLVRAIESPMTLRCWKDRSPKGCSAWHDGSFLALDFEGNRVWLCVWDM